MSKGPSVYFPGLNALRFLAAAAVMVTHIELMKLYFGLRNVWVNADAKVSSFPLKHALNGDFDWRAPMVAEAGPLGVVFFFVLSGYLITYLLCAERTQTGSISIKQFYVRRILRIWPLYYFILLLGFFVLPHLAWFEVPRQSAQLNDNFSGNLLFFTIILPNIAYSLYDAIPNIGQAWSIGVEEQFYFIWPLLMLLYGRSWRVIVVFMAAFIGLKMGVLLFEAVYNPEWIGPLKKFLAMSKMENMAMGALGAWWLYHRREKIPKWVFASRVPWVSAIGVLALVYLTPKFVQNGIHLVHGLLFLLIIVNISNRPRGSEVLENRTFDFLGRISYGIYMYHMMIVVLAMHIVRHLLPETKALTPIQNVLLYLGVTALTIGVSAASYYGMEARFVRMKKKFSAVVSGDNAKEV